MVPLERQEEKDFNDRLNAAGAKEIPGCPGGSLFVFPMKVHNTLEPLLAAYPIHVTPDQHELCKNHPFANLAGA